MNPITVRMSADLVRDLANKLSKPFMTEDVKFRPIGKAYNKMIDVAAFYDKTCVVERLNDVMGLNGWSDEYETLLEGEVRCKLRLCFEGDWVLKSDVGSMSKQEDVGDRAKAAHSDALKRAAIKFGVGLYLSRLKNLRAPYDGSRVTEWPKLPPWATHVDCLPCGKTYAGKVHALLLVACKKANADPKLALSRLYEKNGNYKAGVELADVELRDASAILQDVNTWIEELNCAPAQRVG